MTHHKEPRKAPILRCKKSVEAAQLKALQQDVRQAARTQRRGLHDAGAKWHKAGNGLQFDERGGTLDHSRA